MAAILEQLSIHILILILCLYYGIRIMITKDVGLVLGKEKKKPKNEAVYAKHAGILIIVLGIGSLLMGVISLFNAHIALAEILVVFLVVSILWKKMNEKYGA